jgi:hypothetical protein
MESLKNSKFNSFNNEEWLLGETQSSSVLAGRPKAGSVKGTKCVKTDNGDGTYDICCDDGEKD